MFSVEKSGYHVLEKMQGIAWKTESNTLYGAVDTRHELHYFDEIEGKLLPTSSNITTFLPDNLGIDIDLENHVFINGDKAVMDAYDLSGVSNQEEVCSFILMEKQELFPDYELVIEKGRFPIRVVKGATSYEYKEKVDGEVETRYVYLSPSACFSTHILYVKNYKKHFQKEKNKEKVKAADE